MMDIITGRAPPLARAESHLSKGSRELARPGPSLLETRLIGSSVFGSRNQEKDHGLRTVQRTACPT